MPTQTNKLKEKFGLEFGVAAIPLKINFYSAQIPTYYFPMKISINYVKNNFTIATVAMINLQ